MSPPVHATPEPGPEGQPNPLGLHALVSVVVSCGAGVILHAGSQVPQIAFDWFLPPLILLTLFSTRYRVKVPGRPASVSVSEAFVFLLVLRYGPAPAVLTVALDGLIVSALQGDRRWYRALFNVAEPALSTFAAALVFRSLTDAGTTGSWALTPGLLAATMAMSLTYFALNSWLTALAVALENGGSPYRLWTRHALYLAVNDCAAAGLAVLVVTSGGTASLVLGGLVLPVLVLSYLTYKTAADRVDDATRHAREVEQMYRATVETLAIAVDAKDQVTHGHIRRVQRHTVALARALGVTAEHDLKALEAASLLHDVGKLAVPDYVLNKPGALSEAEFEQVKRHATKGAEILSAVTFPYPVVPIVRHHHEQWCGRGYPDGLAGEQIPLGARILAVVDCFDAVTSDRPYRRRLTDEEAAAILLDRSGTMYDPAVVEAFIRLVPELRRVDAVIDARSAGEAASFAEPVLPVQATGADADTVSPLVMTLLEAAGPVAEADLRRALPGSAVALFARAPARDLLVTAFVSSDLGQSAHGSPFPIGAGLSGWVAAHRHTIVNSSADLDLGEAALARGFRACVSTPVFVLGDLAGVLTVYRKGEGAFTRDEVRLIGALAQRVGMNLAQAEDPAGVSGRMLRLPSGWGRGARAEGAGSRPSSRGSTW